MINDINWWLVTSNLAASPKKKRCLCRRWIGEACYYIYQDPCTQPLTLPQTKNCEPVYSLPLDYRAVNLQCIVFLAVGGSYRSRALAPCHIQAVAVCTEEGLMQFIQLHAAHGQPRDTISFISRWNLPCSSLSSPITSLFSHDYALIKSVSIR